MTAATDFPPLLLGSTSPRRADLLRHLGLRFGIARPAVEEIEEHPLGPSALVRRNAARKAAWVAAQTLGQPVLAADTTVALGDRIFSKPADLAEARAMLEALQGRTHVVHTAVVLSWASRGRHRAQVVTSEVTFRSLAAGDIDRYFAIVNPLDKAGAYGIQEGRELIIQHYRGSLSNIMGLPVEWVMATLQEWGWWSELRRPGAPLPAPVV